MNIINNRDIKKNTDKKKIAVIPIDDRPICYDLIKDVLSIDENITLFMPEINHLGNLKKNADINKLFEFLNNLESVDYLILSLDTIAYGGLIASRRSEDDFDAIKNRILKLKNIIEKKADKILAFSSIMRISNNNINEEEKIYWKDWGEKIFEWSYNLHRYGVDKRKSIPLKIVKDYAKTRKRNFEINKMYLKLAHEGLFDTLIFSKDDCSQYGFNIMEAQTLQEEIDRLLLQSKVSVRTGADEIPLSLISSALCEKSPVHVKTYFTQDNSIDLISKYEDVSVKNCVLGQLSLAGCKIDENNPDLTFIVNNFENEQGDLVLGNKINCFEDKEKIPLNQNYFISDINNANGADKGFIKELFKTKANKNFFGYSAYNTSANSIGSSIFIAIVKFLAQKNKSYNDENFKKIMFIRFVDDWIYQAIIRKEVREKPKNKTYSEVLKEKEEEINFHSKEISKFLNYSPKNISYSLPWERSFEIRVEIKDKSVL